MVKGYSFPIDVITFRNALEQGLPGITFTVSSKRYGEQPFPIYPRTGYGRACMERTEKRYCEDMIARFDVEGVYNNGLKFKFQVTRIIDVEDLDKTEEQMTALAALGNKGKHWGDLKNGLTSYSCDSSHWRSNKTSRRVCLVIGSILSSGEDKKWLFDEHNHIQQIYPDEDYTKPALDLKLKEALDVSRGGYIESSRPSTVSAYPVNYPLLMKNLTEVINEVTIKNTELEDERTRLEFENAVLREKVRGEQDFERRVRESEERATVTAFAVSRERQASLIMEKDLAIKALMESNEKLRQKEEELVLKDELLQSTNRQLHLSNSKLHEAQELNKKWSEWYASRFPTTTSPTSSI